MGIIGVLASVSLFALAGSRESARDSRRKADLEAIRSAVEIYKADCGRYPWGNPGGGGIDFQGIYGDELTGNEGACSPSNTNNYMRKVPKDPSTGNIYRYWSDYATHEICAHLENGTGTVPCAGAVTGNCGAGIDCNYRVVNP